MAKIVVSISDYAAGRTNSSKMRKLVQALEEQAKSWYPRAHQEAPEEVAIQINLSAKYQTTYVSCENWGNYQSVGEFETIIQEALEKRGFEYDETEWKDDSFRIPFE